MPTLKIYEQDEISLPDWIGGTSLTLGEIGHRLLRVPAKWQRSAGSVRANRHVRNDRGDQVAQGKRGDQDGDQRQPSLDGNRPRRGAASKSPERLEHPTEEAK